jgi:hypothetical protein
MNDELAWQRAELVEQARKESSELATKEAMLKTAKMHIAALQKAHALQLESIAALQNAHALQLESIAVERDVERRSTGAKLNDLEAANLEHEKVLARKLDMVKGRDVKLKARDDALRERDAALQALKATHAQEQADLMHSHEAQTEVLEAEHEAAAGVWEASSSASLSKMRRLAGSRGGRPVVSRSADELVEIKQRTASNCHRAMVDRLRSSIGTYGEEGSSAVDSVMTGLKESKFLAAVWESSAMWKLRMEWVEELKEMLSISWDANLTFRFKDQLNLSYDKVDQLRFGFSHHRVGKRLVPRPWVVNPWTGAKHNFPQPIAPRTHWTPLVKTFITDHGLSIDASGTMAQRSFARVLGEQVERDRQRGYLPAIPEESAAARAPTVCVFGADGFSAGNMSMMHVGVSVAPSYVEGIAQCNEVNINTVATSRTDDHWGGLDATLARGYYSGSCDTLPADSILHEFNEMLRTGFCPPSRDGGKPEPVDPVACLDLAAARGIRGGKGKCACHVTADSKDRLKLPEVADDADWPTVRRQLDEAFPFLESNVMRADSHTPPVDWDYVMGPWSCKRAGCSCSFASKAEWRASIKRCAEGNEARQVRGRQEGAREAGGCIRRGAPVGPGRARTEPHGDVHGEGHSRPPALPLPQPAQDYVEVLIRRSYDEPPA